METKTNNAREFWIKVDHLLSNSTIPLSRICKDQGIKYDTLLSSKMRVAYPSLLNTYKLAKALGVQVEFFLSEKEPLTVAAEVASYNTQDPLYKMLDEENDLKALIWRIVQCSAIQIRTIKTMLASWGIGEYDSMGNSKAVVSS